MKELVEFLAKSLVDDAESGFVRVTEEVRDDATVYRLTVPSSQLGRVIGRQGRIAKAIRNVVSAAANRRGAKVFVDIGADEVTEGERSR